MFIKSEVRPFFDKLADSWDAMECIPPVRINTLLDNTGSFEGKDVLDVACGTGVLFPYYKSRNVLHVTAVDISGEMLRIAQNKIGNDPLFTLICDDIEAISFDHTFDRIVVYNAFPHFENAERLIAHLSSLLSENGVLTVAHGLSRARLLQHHSGSACNVSNPLPEVEDLATVFAKYLTVTTVISNDEMYQVAGKKEVRKA